MSLTVACHALLVLTLAVCLNYGKFDDIVYVDFQLWDASTGQAFSQYNEHEKRAWSVDFSQVDPTKLASGSDDCSVKLWNINEACCLFSLSLSPSIHKHLC